MLKIQSPNPIDAEGFSRRYGDARSEVMAANAVIDGLLHHRSVRSYRDRPLPADTLEQIMAAAQSASSSSNLQLWSAVVVRDARRRHRLATVAGGQEHVVSAPLFLVWLADLSRAARVGLRVDVELGALAYTEAFLVAVIDTALAAQNALVAAESMGLGAVYIGGMRNDPQKVAEELGLPTKVMPIFGMCIGWPDTTLDDAVKPRLPQSVVLHHERYGADKEAHHVSEYDETLSKFQHRQGMPARGWSKVEISRLLNASALDGRDTLRSAIHQLGFELR